MIIKRVVLCVLLLLFPLSSIADVHPLKNILLNESREFVCSDWEREDEKHRYPGSAFAGVASYGSLEINDRSLVIGDTGKRLNLKYLGDYNSTGGQIYIHTSSDGFMSPFFVFPTKYADFQIQLISSIPPLTAKTLCNFQ